MANETSRSTTLKVPEVFTSRRPASNDAVSKSTFHNLNVSEEDASRGVKKQKYPLDDYLINPNVQTTLLSPMSPVSSPETVDVLQSAERLIENAQKQIMEVSFNTALNTLDEYPSNYTGQQPLDERLMYVREIVDSKFQECNDPNGVSIRRALSSAPTSNRKLQHDQYPVKDSSGILNKPLEISYQTSAKRSARGMLVQNEKQFLKKATNWNSIEPPTTASNMRSRHKVSTNVSNCTMKNTGMIDINGTNHPTGGIQIQMGPTVDIRSGLTIQTIENVHISPDPSAVSIHNNVATYCFQHEPLSSSSSVKLIKNHGERHSTGSSASRNLFDSINERHIQSTDYNDCHKVVGTAVIRDSNNPSIDTNRTNNGNHGNNIEHRIEGESTTNLHKLSIGNENLQRNKVTEENSHSENVVSTKRPEVESSEKCERDVEHGEKRKFKAALEKIADIAKLRFDTGIVPVQCTQISVDKNLEFVPHSEPEYFEKALENLSKSSKNKTSIIGNSESKDIVSTETKPDVTDVIQTRKNKATNIDSSSTTRYPPASSLASQSRTGESNKYSNPLMPQRTQLLKGKVTRSRIIAKEEKTIRDYNLDLKQPCVFDVDKVLKVYQDSMAAICLGTEQLSQLISHHVIKNAMTTANQISSTITNSTTAFAIIDPKPRSARNKTTHVDPESKPNPIQTINYDQIQAARGPTSTLEKFRATKDIAAFSNENNSVCTNENEYSLTCSRSISGQERNSNEKSSSVQSTIDKDTSDSTVASKEIEHGVAKNSVRKPERNEFSNIQYCVAEQLAGNIPIVVISDEKNSAPQSDLKNPLSAYLDIEYACGRDARSRRRSNYDIHSDQTEDFKLHKCPVIISGPRDNLNESNDFNDKSTEGDNVVQKREMELKIFGQILDAVKNSPQFMKRSIISLFNGMEIDSVNDIVTNLKDADVHPIIIEQFLLILNERNREQSSFGGNLTSTNLSKNKDNMNTFEHSTGFNGSMETTNIQIGKEDENLWVRQTAENQITKTQDAADLESNLDLKFNKDYNINNQSDNSVISEIKSDIQNEASEKLQQETETCESNIAALRERSNTNGLKDSMSINTALKNNDSESNTDKDISFQIPHDADVIDEVVDLSVAQKSSEPLKNGTAVFIELGTEHNSLKLNSLTHDKSQKVKSNSPAGRSAASPAKDNGKLKSLHSSAPDHQTSTKNLQTDDINTVCNCRISTDIGDSNTKPLHIPSPSVNEVDAIIDSHIQNDYKRLGLLDADEKTANRSMATERSGPSKFGATPKSYVRKATEPGKSSVKKKKTFNSKVNEVGKSPRDNKQGSEKSDDKHFCALCMQRRGKCSCLNCSSCIKGSKKGSAKLKTERSKPIRNISTPRQSRSPKGKSPSRKASRPTSKEVSSRSTAEPLGCNSKDCSYGITKKRKGTDEKTQITAPDLNNLKVEDKSMMAADVAHKSTEITATFCNRGKLLDVACSIAPKKLDKVAQVDTVDKPQLKDAGTLMYIENGSSSLNNCPDRMTTTSERITRCSQTLDKSNDSQKHQATSTTGIPDTETVSVIKSTCTNIFDEENIVVLQPLNELDHTFFIAKPNSAERRMIREKINRNFKVKPEEITDQQPSVCDSEDALHVNSKTSPMSLVKSIECQASFPGSPVMENPSCTAAFPLKHETDSKDSFFEDYNQCHDLCTNDEVCLGICPHSPTESDDSRYNCKQDCLNEETCDKICASIPHIEASIETSSIDVNGIIEKLTKFIAENNVPSIKLRIVQDLLKELKNVQDPMNAEKKKLGTIDERSESQSNREIENSVYTIKPRSEVEDGLRRSLPYEKVERMMMNTKSLILHNIVRGVADMHPSTKMERLNIRTGDPLVEGCFNKSKAEKRYSFFNKMESERSSIDVNDPKIMAKLAHVAEMARIKNQHTSLPDYRPAVNNEKSSANGKSNNKHAAKVHKSRHATDADTHLSDQSNKPSVRPDINSMKSVESSDLESGEFYKVQKPFDDPTKPRRNIGKLSQDESKCEGLCDDDQSPQNTSNTTDIENKYEDSDETVFTQKKNIGDNERNGRNKAETMDSMLEDQSNRKNVKKEDSTPDTSNPADLDSTHDTTHSKMNNDQSHGISYGNQEAKNPQIHSERFIVNRSGCNRPRIIDHFLGKRKLEDMEIEYSDDKFESISKGYPRLGGGTYCQHLNMNSKTESSVVPIGKRNDDKDWRNFNEASIRRWDHTSSDTYSEGEINLPSSCSYSVGEIKLSTPSSTTAGKSYKDPDGFTIFVTKSILDSIHATCTSPGEILAEIRKTSTDSSSSSS